MRFGMTGIRARPRRILLVGLIAGFAFGGLGPLRAGGVNLGGDDSGADEGPSFFGFIRDADGSAVTDAKVTAAVKSGGALVTRSNSMGVYKFSGFGKDIDPDSVTISCAKDGYRQANVVPRSRAGADSKDPVEVECYLQKE